MSAKTNTVLSTQAQVIANETTAALNSAVRIGAMAQDLNDSKINIDAIDIDVTLASNSDVKVASQKAVKAIVATKQASLGFTPEDIANKSTNVTTDGASDTKYPSVKAVKDYADTKVGLTSNETISGAKTYTVPQTFASNLFANGPVNLSNDTYIQQNVSLAPSGGNFGTAGQVFTSQGAGACPIWTGEKVYRAYLSQSSTSAPTAVIAKNSLGVVPTLARTAAGIYTITAVGVFTAGKTFVSNTLRLYPFSGTTFLQVFITIVSADVIQIQTSSGTNGGGVNADGILATTDLEIIVHP